MAGFLCLGWHGSQGAVLVYVPCATLLYSCIFARVSGYRTCLGREPRHAMRDAISVRSCCDIERAVGEVIYSIFLVIVYGGPGGVRDVWV